MTARMRKAIQELQAAVDAADGPLAAAMARRLRREWPELVAAIEAVLKASG